MQDALRSRILRSFSVAERAKQGFRSTEGNRAMYVYLLRSAFHPDQRYVGLTSDLKKRLAEHNAGKSPHTSKFAPWECVAAVWFQDDQKAEAFETYLKHGSGHAFARRHFW